MSFSDKFLWGAASAAYQIEGAYKEDGKGLNIWDELSRMDGRVLHNENGDVACDHYRRFKEDIALMKKIGLKSYRFSISWARVLPDGTGKVNPKGIQFYSDLVDELIKNGIEPMVTLFHWDYPMELFKRGGWMNPESPLWFEEYTKVIVEALSDRVTYWMTLNEPQMFMGLGYEDGIFAPFLQMTRKELIQMSHHVLLAHGRAVRVIRKFAVKDPSIGFASTAPSALPADNSLEAIEEARKQTFGLYVNGHFLFGTSWWADPVLKGCYPKEAYELFGEDMIEMSEEDKQIIMSPIDFFGANIYQSINTNAQIRSDYESNASIGCMRTTMEWPVTPDVLYWSLKFLYERYELPILITENGMANTDWEHLDGAVHDPQRIDYMKRYLRACKKAVKEGVPMMGYQYWSIMDNFEWASGYDKRFGLIYVDYKTQKRILKDSAYWYRDTILNNGEDL